MSVLVSSVFNCPSVFDRIVGTSFSEKPERKHHITINAILFTSKFNSLVASVSIEKSGNATPLNNPDCKK